MPVLMIRQSAQEKRLVVAFDKMLQFAKAGFAMLLGTFVLLDVGRASEVCGSEHPSETRPKSSMPLLLSVNKAA